MTGRKQSQLQVLSLILKFDKKDNFAQSRIDITFSDQVSIVVTNFPKFNAAYLLSACGGSMGMWLGVSVVHIVEILGKIILKIKINK